MTDVEVRKLVAVLMGAFPAIRTAPNTAAVFERMLCDLDYAAANAAIERLLATSRFMPSVAEIREATLALTAGEQRPGGDGWGDVLDAVSRFGIYRVPGADFQFEDSVVAHCVRQLGWEEICNSENQVADRARFIELYERHAKIDRQRQLSDSLPAMQRFRALSPAPAAPRVSAMGGVTKIERPAELPAGRPVGSEDPFGAAMANLIGEMDGEDVH